MFNAKQALYQLSYILSLHHLFFDIKMPISYRQPLFSSKFQNAFLQQLNIIYIYIITIRFFAYNYLYCHSFSITGLELSINEVISIEHKTHSLVTTSDLEQISSWFLSKAMHFPS